MKIRNGFVSNSSSSSFIIQVGGEFNSVRDVALFMLDKKKQEFLYFYDDNDKKYKKHQDKLKKSLYDVDENSAVAFNSTNYDTYIIRFKNVILVSTCNNINWDLPDVIYNIDEESFKELSKLFNDKNEAMGFINDYEFYLQSKFDKFYSLEHQIIGTEGDNYCKKCNTFSWKTRIGDICPICNPVLKRKKKLKKIKKIETK